MRINKTLWMMILVFVIVGIAVIDGSSLLFAKWQLSDFGDVAASDGAADYAIHTDLASAKLVAQATLDDRDSNATVAKVTVDQRTQELTFVIKKEASALFIDKVSVTEKWTHLVSVKTVPIPDN